MLILGLDNAGKSTYLEQTKTVFRQNTRAFDPNKVTTTVGLNIGKVDIGSMRLNFWDLGGQEELQALWDKYYSESQAIIWVVDSSDPERLNESFEAFRNMIASASLYDIPLLIVANKRDLQNCLPVNDLKNKFLGDESLISSRARILLPSSALKGDGVHDGIEWLAQHLSAIAPASAAN